MKLGIQIDQKFQPCLSQEWLQEVVEHSLSVQSHGAEVELGLLITDDETMQELNRRYRGIDEPTDVLSFALTEGRPEADLPGFVAPPDGILHLGEVIVSYPRAVEQAKERKHGTSKELALLVIHGTLHLLGFEHDEPARERELRAVEQRILSEVEGNLTTTDNGDW